MEWLILCQNVADAVCRCNARHVLRDVAALVHFMLLQGMFSVGAMNLISRCTFHAADTVQHVLHFTVLDMFVAVAGPSFWEVTTFHCYTTVKCTEAYVALSGVWLCLYHCVLPCMPMFCCVDFVPGVFSEWRKGSVGKSVA